MNIIKGEGEHGKDTKTAKKAAKKPAAKKKATEEGRPAQTCSKEAQKKVIALFPEAAFGPALNSVGIGQALEKLGHKVVFLSDPGFLDVYKGYGFEAYPVNLSEPLPPEQMAKFWVDFINGHIPNFRKTPYEQIDNYVKDCWSMIVETAKWAEKDLPGVLDMVKPDVVCVDNVILFPAIKRYAKQNKKPWVRIISCSENEIEDPDIPPHLSGCGCEGQEGPSRATASASTK
jgi:UDP:flavonoid glycosyltransferase YjiC (YdhE family)